MITTDYFDICESATITLLRNASEFGWKDANKQVAKSNDVFLDKGYACNAITYPGAFPQTRIGDGMIFVDWEIMIDLLVRWDKTEAEAWAEFKSFRSKVFNLFNLSYEGRNLNRTPSIAPNGVILNSNDRPRYIPLNRNDGSDTISHIAQVTLLTVTQVIDKEK